jgi:excisionase family DNA binding protein
MKTLSLITMLEMFTAWVGLTNMPIFISASRAAEILGLEKSWVRRLLIKGKIKATKIEGNNSWLINEEDVLKYKAKHDAKS